MNDIGPQLVQFNVLGVGVQPSLPIVQKTQRRLRPISGYYGPGGEIGQIRVGSLGVWAPGKRITTKEYPFGEMLGSLTGAADTAIRWNRVGVRGADRVYLVDGSIAG